MSSEQLGQLYELMHATKDVWKTPSVSADEELNDAQDSTPTSKE